MIPKTFEQQIEFYYIVVFVFRMLIFSSYLIFSCNEFDLPRAIFPICRHIRTIVSLSFLQSNFHRRVSSHDKTNIFFSIYDELQTVDNHWPQCQQACSTTTKKHILLKSLEAVLAFNVFKIEFPSRFLLRCVFNRAHNVHQCRGKKCSTEKSFFIH